MKINWVLCALLLLAGCGKKADRRPAAPQSSASTAAAVNPNAGEATGAPAEMDYSKTLDRLTQALRKFSAETRTVPKSLDELVTFGYLPEMPEPPSGKKFVFDDKLRVVLKDAK